MRRTLLAVALIVSLLIVVAGFFVVVSPAEAQISETHDESVTLQNRIVQDQEFVREFPKTQADRKKQLAGLRPINLHANASQMVSQFVADMDHSVRQNGIGFMNVQVSSTPPVLPAVANPGSATPAAPTAAKLLPDTVRLKIQGTYNQILEAVASISRAGELARIDQVSFHRHVQKDPSADPVLEADIGVTLFAVSFPPAAPRVLAGVDGEPTLPQTGAMAPQGSATASGSAAAPQVQASMNAAASGGPANGK
jgi:hypothetical protein